MKRKKKYTQRGHSILSIDRMFKAKPVGWRISSTGHRYFENRKNRSDRDRRKRI